MSDGYVDPLDALATSMGFDINNLPGQQPPAQARLNFKTHVDLTEIYGEFYMDLADLLTAVVGSQHASGALDDYSTIAPTVFGDLVMSIFEPNSGKKPGLDGTVIKGGTLMRLRQYFPTVTQKEGGQAQYLLEKTMSSVSMSISRSERAADTRLRGQFGYSVDIIHSYHPKPFLNLTGESATVTIYGEVWDKSAAVEEPLSPEEFDDDELAAALPGAYENQPLGFVATGHELSPLSQAVANINDNGPDCFSLLDSVQTRF